MTKIVLTYINGVAYTFNANDYMKIRTEYRIKGNLIGCIASNPRNSNHAGLPAIYTSCEAQLLLDNGFITLISKTDLTTQSSDEPLHYKAQINDIRKEQNDFLKENKLVTTRKMMDKIIAGKKKKLLKMGKTEDEINITPEEILEEERQKIPDVTDSTALLQIPTQHPFPSTTHNEITAICPIPRSGKYKIYRDLWSKGYFITEGDTFGGDWLLYPGDPIYFHASHIVHILDTPIIAPKVISGNCRLSVNVNKSCLYAYVNPETEQILYETVKWKGNLQHLQ